MCDGQDRRQLTPDMRRALLVERERSGVLLEDLLEVEKNLPPALTLEEANSWLCSQPKRIVSQHYDALLALWRRQPDEPDNRIPLTEEMYLELANQRDRTGVKPTAILKDASGVPDGLTSGLVQRWLHGKRPVKSVRSHFYIYVLDLWQSLPDKPPDNEQIDGRVALTEAMADRLQHERERTGCAVKALLADREYLPEGLTPSIAASWMQWHGRAKSLNLEHYRYVLDLWADLPDDPDPRIPFTETMQEALLAEQTRTGVDASRLAALASARGTELSASFVRTCLGSGKRAGTIRAQSYKAMLDLLRSLPDSPMIPLTPSMQSALRRERERTGVGPQDLLATDTKCSSAVPISNLRKWLGLTSAPKRVVAEHYDHVLSLWQALPASPYARLTETLRTLLRAEWQRSGVGPTKLLRLIDPLPDGLTVGTLHSWFDKKRARKRVRRDHLTTVLDTWRKLPDGGILEITEEIRRELLAQKERSGLGPHALLSRAGIAADEVKPETVENWLTRKAKRAEQQQLDLVRRLWAEAPDSPKGSYVDLNAEQLEEMRQLRRSSGLGPQALLRGANDRPDGLTSPTIASWLTGSTQRVPSAYLTYVLERWRNAPKRQPLTAEMRAELRRLHRQTGVGSARLLKRALDIPRGLTASTIAGWLEGPATEITQEHYDYVVALWRGLEQAGVKGERIPLNRERLEVLRHERERSGIGPTHLMTYAEDIPQGLTQNMITNWLMGQNQRVRRDHYDFVLELWRSLPNQTH